MNSNTHNLFYNMQWKQNAIWLTSRSTKLHKFSPRILQNKLLTKIGVGRAIDIWNDRRLCSLYNLQNCAVERTCSGSSWFWIAWLWSWRSIDLSFLQIGKKINYLSFCKLVQNTIVHLSVIWSKFGSCEMQICTRLIVFSRFKKVNWNTSD